MNAAGMGAHTEHRWATRTFWGGCLLIMGMLLLPVVLIVEGAIGLAMASAYRPESWTFALLDLCVAVPYCIGLVLVGGTPLRVGSRDASSLRFSGTALKCAGALPIALLAIHYGLHN